MKQIVIPFNETYHVIDVNGEDYAVTFGEDYAVTFGEFTLTLSAHKSASLAETLVRSSLSVALDGDLQLTIWRNYKVYNARDFEDYQYDVDCIIAKWEDDVERLNLITNNLPSASNPNIAKILQIALDLANSIHKKAK